MARKISIQPDEEPVDVDLWGTKYVTTANTKDTVLKSAALINEYGHLVGNENLGPDEIGELVEFYKKTLDVMLKPANGSKTKPSTLVGRKWDSGGVSLDQLSRLVDDISQAHEEEAAAPPT
jgi:hypothetical protein